MKQQVYDGDAYALRCSVATMAGMLRISPQWLYELARRGWFDVADDGTVGVQETLHGFLDSKTYSRPY